MMKILTIFISLFLFVSCASMTGQFKGDKVFCGSFKDAQEATVSNNLFYLTEDKEYSTNLFSKYLDLPTDYKKIGDSDYYYYGQECVVIVEVTEDKVTNISASEKKDNGCVSIGANLGAQVGQYTWTINTATWVGCLIQRPKEI